ncbi:aminotransferase [Bradyrhizobium sp. LHD-71]|uniref:aminotransferase n=1 Tax=Bradyrhizobium sp. LHD-71 TaxID=3072141 RepID=UPI00280D262F|nr:aminotransferase [Bradyrhizobium sp. LHD-71]MDQ8727994.1 aminotransferase [Bradyrhizobium sp. LHD-71]
MQDRPGLPNVASLRERDIAFHFHPMTNPAKHERVGPTIVAGGEGCYFEDEQGKRYLDMHAGLWCTALGLSEQRLKDAAMRQFDKLSYSQTFAHRTTEPVVELADALIRLAPASISKVQFQCSGSEANDTAVKFAWFYWAAKGEPQRRKIIARTKAYHGTTAVAASMTHLPHMHKGFGLPLPGFLHAPHPDIYRGIAEGESEADYATRLVGELEKIIEQEGPDTVAAFIAEPVMGAGGVYPPPLTYFEKVQDLLKQYGILFIADEVICGFGRTGRWWGSQTFEIKPDIVTCAKALSSAYLPISATMISDRVYAEIRAEAERNDAFGHGYTYGGHPVCAAVACEAVRIYEDDRLIEQAALRGKFLERKLRALESHPLVGQVRGAGLMWGVEIVKDKATKAAFDTKLQVGVELSDICFSRGLNTRSLGSGIMTFTPPLIVSEQELSIAVSKFTESLDELHGRMTKDGRLN